MVEPLRTHSNLPCRPASPFITVVRGGSTGLQGSRGKQVKGEAGLRVSSGRFDNTEPPPNHCDEGGSRPTGQVQVGISVERSRFSKIATLFFMPL